MAALPSARPWWAVGRTGRPAPRIAPRWRCWAAPLVALLSLGLGAFAAALAAALSAGLVALAASRRSGGQTGDILGASQQLAFAAVLAVVAGGA